MTCEHKNTSVKDSRLPDYRDSKGMRMFRPLPFRCLVIRTRKCIDCGENFKTYELLKDEIDRLQDAALSREDIERQVLEELAEAIRARLPERGESFQQEEDKDEKEHENCG
jgi:transcriptional regulator NrdR family protein